MLTGLQKQGIPIPPSIQQAAALTPYATTARYPGLADPVTLEEYTQAVVQAEQVVQWAESLFSGQRP